MDTSMDGALQNTRVIDLTQGLAGPYTGMLLAEQGADVIKIEPPVGDRSRGTPHFHVLNRSKRGIVLDLEQPDGRARSLDLMSGADVVLVDQLPERLAALGIDYSAVVARNPQVVYCNTLLYGSKGRWADLPQDDNLLAAMGGICGSQWTYSESPVFLVSPFAAYAGGMLAASAVTATLFDRARTGCGDYIESPGLAGVFALEGSTYIAPLGAMEIYRLSGSHGDPKGPFPTYRIYQAGDGNWFLLACLTPVFWTKLVLALDFVEWLADPRYVGAPVAIPVIEDRLEISERLKATFATQPMEYWVEFLRANDVPVAPVQRRSDYLDDPQVIVNNMRIELDDPEVGKTVQMGVPVSLSDTPGAIRGPAPLLGQHTDEVLSESAKAPATGECKSLPEGRAPLDGVTVLDLGTVYAGPFGAMLLSDMGANVIKVEPLDGDAWRSFAFGFLGANRGKRSIAINLKSEEGLQAFYDLVRKADIVTDNFRAGVSQRLKIDYDSLRAINPRIICCTTTPFGSKGEMAGMPGFDPLLQALSGLMRAQGGEGQEPVFHQIAVCDFIGALLGAFAMVSALHARERTGRGQRVETSLSNGAITAQAGEFVRYEGRPADPPGGPKVAGISAAYRIYPCSEKGFIFLAVRTAEQAEALRSLVGDTLGGQSGEELLNAPLNGDVASALAAFFGQQARDEIIRCLLDGGIPCAPCLEFADLFDEEHLTANDFWWDTEHPINGPVRQTGRIMKWERRAMRLERPAPTLGQHSREILLECGIDPARIEELVAKGVILAPE